LRIYPISHINSSNISNILQMGNATEFSKEEHRVRTQWNLVQDQLEQNANALQATCKKLKIRNATQFLAKVLAQTDNI